MTQPVVIVGGGVAGRCVAAELRAAGVDFTTLEREVLGSAFDDATDTWTLSTCGGESWRAAVVIAAHRQPFVPWIPDLAGRNDFRGVSFHAGAWDRQFDPTGKRVAVIGADATAGFYIGRLSTSAASVTVFAYPPRRVVEEVPLATTRAKRRLHLGKQPRPAAEPVRSAIDAVTASGIRTRDGVEHEVDAIVYGTGFAIRSEETLVGSGGLSIRQAWRDGMEPYLGVAVHGFPNYFWMTGPDLQAQARYIVECLGLMTRTAGTRIEVRRSSQQVFNERVYLRPPRHHGVASAFDVSSGGQDDVYDGLATLTVAGVSHRAHVRLTGHLDPIDGHYHWQGTVFDHLPAAALRHARAVTLTVGDRSAPAHVGERTPLGAHSVAGVGAPPFVSR